MPMPNDMKADLDKAIPDAEVFSFDADTFVRHVGDGDIVGIVIRGHLYLEHILIRSLRGRLLPSRRARPPALNVPTKLDLSIVLRPSASGVACAAAIKINEMRN